MSKRKRANFKPKRRNVWDSLLQSWSILKELTPLKDLDGNRSWQFIVHHKPVTITAIESEGMNSNIFSVHFNNREYILKQHDHTTAGNVPGIIEAELHSYAAGQGFAPECKAYNEEAILIEKCTELQWPRPIDCYTNRRGLDTNLRGEYNRLRTGLSQNGQQILKLSKKMGTDLGMYNIDQNPDNYMVRDNGDFVQIDYGMNRFFTGAGFKKFYRQMSTTLYTKKQLRKMLLVQKVAYPPAYYWGHYFFSVEGRLAYDKRAWDVVIKKMGGRMAEVCGLLNAGTPSKLVSKKLSF